RSPSTLATRPYAAAEGPGPDRSRRLLSALRLAVNYEGLRPRAARRAAARWPHERVATRSPRWLVRRWPTASRPTPAWALLCRLASTGQRTLMDCLLAPAAPGDSRDSSSQSTHNGKRAARATSGEVRAEHPTPRGDPVNALSILLARPRTAPRSGSDRPRHVGSTEVHAARHSAQYQTGSIRSTSHVRAPPPGAGPIGRATVVAPGCTRHDAPRRTQPGARRCALARPTPPRGC